MDHNTSRVPSNPTGKKEAEQRASIAERGRGLYDRWATNQSLYGLIAQANARGRERACDHLELSGGERALEIGCGPGVNFELLVDGVGSEGTVVGVDYSAEMVQRATARTDEHGWENVEVTRGDVTQALFEAGTFDAAFASLVLSTIPTPRDAIESVYGALKPGGRFVVFDAAARYHDGPMQLLNPLRARFVSHAFNHQQQDVLTELRAVFDRVRVTETFRAESEYVAVAVKQPNTAREVS
jgi:demethylmenaquinone methyltransferase/2-methoxy-6-polyprenyl-1,4-benzoquinol methylase